MTVTIPLVSRRTDTAMRDRRKYPTGIYDRGTYWYSVAKVGRDLREDRRFPKDTAIRTIVYWQEEARARLRKDAKALALRKARAGTLAGDVQRYLEARASMPTLKQREQHLELWGEAIGWQRSRSTIEPWEIRAVTERWKQGGLAGGSLNRRLNALSNVWTVLDGRHKENPVKAVERYQEDGRKPPPLTFELAELIIQAMPDRGQGLRGRKRSQESKTKARLFAMLYTGLPGIRIARIEADDIDAEHSAVWLVGRRKGKWRKGRWYPLSTRGLQAILHLVAVGGLGRFSKDSLRGSFRRSAKRHGRTDLTPYDLRHLYARTMDHLTRRDKVRDLMDHGSLKTTEEHYLDPHYIPAELRDAQRRFDEYVSNVLARSVGAAPTILVNITAKSNLIN